MEEEENRQRKLLYQSMMASTDESIQKLKTVRSLHTNKKDFLQKL